MPGNGRQASDEDKPKKTYYPNGKLGAILNKTSIGGNNGYLPLARGNSNM